MTSSVVVTWSVISRHSHGLVTQNMALETPDESIRVAPLFSDPSDDELDTSLCSICVDPVKPSPVLGCHCSAAQRPAGMPSTIDIEFSSPLVAAGYSRSFTERRQAYIGHSASYRNGVRQSRLNFTTLAFAAKGSQYPNFNAIGFHSYFYTAGNQPYPPVDRQNWLDEDDRDPHTYYQQIDYTISMPGCDFTKTKVRNFRRVRNDIPIYNGSNGAPIFPIQINNQCSWWGGSGSLRWSYHHPTVVRSKVVGVERNVPLAVPDWVWMKWESFTFQSGFFSTTAWRYKAYPVWGANPSPIKEPTITGNASSGYFVAELAANYYRFDETQGSSFCFKPSAHDLYPRTINYVTAEVAVEAEKTSGEITLTNYDPLNAAYLYMVSQYMVGDQSSVAIGDLRTYGYEVQGQLDDRVQGPSTNPGTNPLDTREHPVAGVPISPSTNDFREHGTIFISTGGSFGYETFPTTNGVYYNSLKTGNWDNEVSIGGYVLELRLIGRCFILNMYGSPAQFEATQTGTPGNQIKTNWGSPVVLGVGTGLSTELTSDIYQVGPVEADLPSITWHGVKGAKQWWSLLFGTPNYYDSNGQLVRASQFPFSGGMRATNDLGQPNIAQVPWGAPFVTTWGVQGANHLASWISSPTPCSYSGKVRLRKVCDIRTAPFAPVVDAPAGPMTFPEYAFVDIGSAVNE